MIRDASPIAGVILSRLVDSGKVVMEKMQRDPNVKHLIRNYPVNAVIVDGDAKAEQYDCTVAAEEIKGIRPEVPVIMLSTRHWVGKDYCDGADYNIVKGGSPVEMIRAIEKIMGDTQPEVRVESSERLNRSA
jgi:hypothetical protein